MYGIKYSSEVALKFFIMTHSKKHIFTSKPSFLCVSVNKIVFTKAWTSSPAILIQLVWRTYIPFFKSCPGAFNMESGLRNSQLSNV